MSLTYAGFVFIFFFDICIHFFFSTYGFHLKNSLDDGYVYFSEVYFSKPKCISTSQNMMFEAFNL